MKKVLVTGGAGFIGSHLCKKLLKNYDVLCVDNLYTGNKENIYELLQHKNFEFLRHDITFPLYVEVDEIYNLACPASPIHYQRDPVQTMKSNILGSINMLGLSKRTKAKILQASTSEVYGDPEINPQNETYTGNVNIHSIRACYDEGKRASETLFMDYYRQHNVNIRIARIFNTYGPNMQLNDGRVISNFIIQAINNQNITIYGDGKQTRSFCYVDDLVDGLILMMENSESVHAPINLGNPIEISILDLAKYILKKVKSESKIEFCNLPMDDPKIRCPDINKARKILNWDPKVNLNNGLDFTVEYFKKFY